MTSNPTSWKHLLSIAVPAQISMTKGLFPSDLSNSPCKGSRVARCQEFACAWGTSDNYGPLCCIHESNKCVLPATSSTCDWQTALVQFLVKTDGVSISSSWHSFFLLAELLSVRCAPVSERAKACKEAKGNKKQTKKAKTSKQTNKPNHTQNPHKTKNTKKHHNHAKPFAASETGETGETKSAQDR